MKTCVVTHNRSQRGYLLLLLCQHHLAQRLTSLRTQSCRARQHLPTGESTCTERAFSASSIETIVNVHRDRSVALRARVHDAIMHAKHVCAWLSHHEHPSSDQTSSVLHVTCASRIADAINRTQSLECQCSRQRLRSLQRHRRLRSTMQPSAQCVASISQAASVSRTMQQHHGLHRRLHQSHHEHNRFRPATSVHS